MYDNFDNPNYRYHRGGRVLMVCARCGVTVADIPLHDEWHDSVALNSEVVFEGELVTDSPTDPLPEIETH